MTIDGPGLQVLHGLKLTELDAFMAACIPAQVPAGTLLIAEGDEDRSMLFVRDGELEIFVGQPPHEVVVGRLDRGAHAGAVGLLRLVDQRMASVRTRTQSDLLVLERAGLERLDSDGNSVVSNLEVDILHALIERLRELTNHLVRLTEGRDSLPSLPGQSASVWARMRRYLVGEDEPEEFEPDVAEALQICPELRGLSPEVLELLLPQLSPVAVGEGERLCDQDGDVGDAYMVVSGRIGMYRSTRLGGPMLLAELGLGDLLGIEGIIDFGSPLGTLVALEPSWLLRIPKALCGEAVVMRTPVARTLRRAMMGAAARRLQVTTRRLVQLGTTQVHEGKVAGEEANEVLRLALSSATALC